MERSPVTIPLVICDVPAKGDVSPLPWIWEMVFEGEQMKGPSTVRAKGFEAVPTSSVTLIVKLNGEPAVLVGVPVRTPAELMAKSKGSVLPTASAQLVVPVAPAAVKDWL